MNQNQENRAAAPAPQAAQAAPAQAGPAQAAAAPQQQSSTEQLFVRTVTGKSIIASFTPEMTTMQLKQFIADHEMIPVDQQRLVFGGRQLEDERPLSFYAIQGGATINLVLRLRGGAL